MEISDFVNLDLLLHPYNWLIVILMLAIGYGALMLIQKPLSELPTGTATVF